MIDLLIEKINKEIEMYQFVHGKTGSVVLDIRDIKKLINKYKENKKLYLNELDKTIELQEKIENLEKSLDEYKKDEVEQISDADELFRQLGYKKVEDKYNIDFNKRYTFTHGDRIQEQIRFCKLDKYVHIENFSFNDGITFGKFLDSQELEAINLKMKELNWIRE